MSVTGSASVGVRFTVADGLGVRAEIGAVVRVERERDVRISKETRDRRVVATKILLRVADSRRRLLKELTYNRPKAADSENTIMAATTKGKILIIIPQSSVGLRRCLCYHVGHSHRENECQYPEEPREDKTQVEEPERYWSHRDNSQTDDPDNEQ